MKVSLNSMHARDVAHTLHPFTNLGQHEKDGPLVIKRGDGIYVIDDEGNRYIEGLSGLFCASLGFSEKRLVDAATRQLNELPFYHTFGGNAVEPGIALAEKLLAVAPVPMSKVFFANSGSEANDTAVKLVWYYHNAIGKPAKKKIISRMNAYHGVTVATASLTGLPHLHAEFDLPIPGILHTECPSLYRYGLPGESADAFTTRMAASLEALILREGPDTVGAFFAEPVLASGGVVIPPPGYYEKIQAVLRRYDILLIADEVICGFGRTGQMFGCETFGMRPDMITVAKQLSSAYIPISALMVNETIYRAMVAQSEKLGTFGHGFTYSGHPVASAVALETLKIYEERDILGHVQDIAPYFQDLLLQFAGHPLVGEARGIGLIGTLELVADKQTKRSFARPDGVVAYMGQRARAHGLITRALGSNFTLCPPLIITREQIGDMMRCVGLALDDALGWARERGLING